MHEHFANTSDWLRPSRYVIVGVGVLLDPGFQVAPNRVVKYWERGVPTICGDDDIARQLLSADQPRGPSGGMWRIMSVIGSLVSGLGRRVVKSH
jgi:hypothetical protein